VRNGSAITATVAEDDARGGIGIGDRGDFAAQNASDDSIRSEVKRAR
jgi:hypothetical protein